MPLPLLIAPLLKAGLGLIANAALAKGKEWVEERTGVELDKPLSEEAIVKLKQFELENETELMRLRLEENKLDAEVFKAEVADKGDARKRDIEFLRVGRKNYRADFMFFLAVLMIAGLVWIVWKDPSINEYVKGIFTLVLGRFLGYLDNIYNFEYGSTRGSKDKDDTIKQLSGGPR
jgi:hypothetical protein